MENDGDEDVVLIGCINPSLPVLQKLVDGVWTTVYAVAEPECLSPPWFVEPGEIHRDTLRVDAVLDPDVVPTPRWDNGITLDGTYRLERMIYTDHRTSEFGDPLPLTERVTPTFEIRARHSSTLP